MRVADKDAVLRDADVLAACDEVEQILGESGRILLRKSGTEPVVRVMVEAPTEELCLVHADRVIAVIKDKGLLLR